MRAAVKYPMPTNPTAESPLKAVGLKKNYVVTPRFGFSRHVQIVRAVDMDLALWRGETLGLVGESGCGKSTLARLLMGLEAPSAGHIELLGRDLAALKPKELRRLRRNMQMVFQDPYTSLNPRLTVEQIVMDPLEIHSGIVEKSRRRARVRELLTLVGVNPLNADRYPHQFSGGQRQRIGIARALALEPEILICDEPVSALDVSVQAQVVNLLEDLKSELRMSYIFIAHDLSVVRHIADRVAVMYLGNIVEMGPKIEIYERPSHPYTEALLSAVPVPDPKARDRRRRIVLTGDPPSPANPPSGCKFRTRCWKAEELCAIEVPTLRPRGSTGHEVACHFPAGDPIENPPLRSTQ